MSNARELAELGGAYAAGGINGFKNRIINGGMMIDQRNAGASVSIATTSNVYTLDRWAAAGQSADGVFTVQRDTTVPAGFTQSMKMTVTTADSSIGSSQYYLMQHHIEGFNTADLNFGTANAANITLSFWVRSSVTGTFGGSLRNSGYNRSCPFSYTINSANTWEYKTITLAGDTSGTWNTESSIGILVTWSLGDGSSRLGTAGVWAGANYSGVTGQTNLIATNGATFYLTGVQLEKGSTATSFDYRPYGTELQLCQRYFEVAQPNYFIMSKYNASLSYGLVTTFKVEKRATPSFSYTGTYVIAHGSGQGGSTNRTLSTDSINVWSHTGSIPDGTYGSYFCGIESGKVFQYSAEL